MAIDSTAARIGFPSFWSRRVYFPENTLGTSKSRMSTAQYRAWLVDNSNNVRMALPLQAIISLNSAKKKGVPRCHLAIVARCTLVSCSHELGSTTNHDQNAVQRLTLELYNRLVGLSVIQTGKTESWPRYRSRTIVTVPHANAKLLVERCRMPDPRRHIWTYRSKSKQYRFNAPGIICKIWKVRP